MLDGTGKGWRVAKGNRELFTASRDFFTAIENFLRQVKDDDALMIMTKAQKEPTCQLLPRRS